ncbi:MAG: hypothetical protein ACYC3I_25770 [Gemmataceae bacterium]
MVSTDTISLIERLRAGDRKARSEVFTRQRGRLRRMVEICMDWRLLAESTIPAVGACQSGRVVGVAFGRVGEYSGEPSTMAANCSSVNSCCSRPAQ